MVHAASESMTRILQSDRVKNAPLPLLAATTAVAIDAHPPMTTLFRSHIGAFAAASFISLAALTACSASTQNQDAADAYIRSNVSALSLTPAVLGGTFYVTDIEWEDEDTAIVSYEDGHIALKGRTNIVHGDDGVTVTEFVIVDAGTDSTSSTAVAASSAVSSVTERPRSKEGEICGGIAGFQCDFGLICIYDGAYPDAAGTCAR